jgi:hypothetical protein
MLLEEKLSLSNGLVFYGTANISGIILPPQWSISRAKSLSAMLTLQELRWSFGIGQCLYRLQAYHLV